MNTNIQSRALAAILVLASTFSASFQPTFAASTTAVAPVSASLNATPAENQALLNQVKGLIKSGKVQEALNLIDQAIKNDPRNATAYVIKAVVMHTVHADDKAIIADLSIAISLSPNYESAIYMRGLVYEDMNDLRNAVKDFDACIALDHHNADAISESVKIKFNQKDWHGVMAVLQILFANNSVNAKAYVTRAVAECNLGQKSAAIADFKQAQKMFMAENDLKNAQAMAKIISDLQNA